MYRYARYDELIDAHDRIEVSIASEMQRPLPDSLQLQRLKRQKLLIRDELASWERLISVIRYSTGPRVDPVHA